LAFDESRKKELRYNIKKMGVSDADERIAGEIVKLIG